MHTLHVLANPRSNVGLGFRHRLSVVVRQLSFVYTTRLSLILGRRDTCWTWYYKLKELRGWMSMNSFSPTGNADKS